VWGQRRRTGGAGWGSGPGSGGVGCQRAGTAGHYGADRAAAGTWQQLLGQDPQTAAACLAAAEARYRLEAEQEQHAVIYVSRGAVGRVGRVRNKLGRPEMLRVSCGYLAMFCGSPITGAHGATRSRVRHVTPDFPEPPAHADGFNSPAPVYAASHAGRSSSHAPFSRRCDGLCHQESSNP
jgi:hypothetical protein